MFVKKIILQTILLKHIGLILVLIFSFGFPENFICSRRLWRCVLWCFAKQIHVILLVEKWSDEQNEYLRIRCARNILNNIVLRKTDAESIINESSFLRDRSWTELKNKVSA